MSATNSGGMLGIRSSKSDGNLSNSCLAASSRICCHSSSECTLYQTSEKLMLRSGKLMKRGRFLPTRRRSIQVQLYLVPPMIVYEDAESDKPKVVHLDGGFIANYSGRNNMVVLKHQSSSRRLVFEVADKTAGHAADWVADINNTLKMIADKSLPDCADFMPFEQVIDDFHDAFAKRDASRAEACFNRMESTLNGFLMKYADNKSLNYFGDKYQAWLEIASLRLDDLHQHNERRLRHRLSTATASTTSEGDNEIETRPK